MPGMNDRDHFAAAALTGLLCNGDYSMESIPRHACSMADAMLRERANHIADAGKMVETPEETQDGPASTPQVPRKLPRLLSGLQELINRSNAEAGSNTPDYVLADFLDDVRHAFDAAVRERERWYGRRNHDAAPAATANAESVAPQPTAGDRAGNPPSHSGTGDTPATRATRGEGSVPREGTQEPVAWGVASEKGLIYATSLSRMDAVDMQSEYACDTHIVPLYRHPPCQDFSQNNLTLTDAEREAVAWAEDCADSQREWKIGATLRGLLERLGVEQTDNRPEP